MAFSSGTTFEIQQGGSNANSGGFNAAGATPGTDRTQSTTPWVDIDNATITATVHTTTTQLTLVGYTVSAADIRNTIQIKAGGTSAVTGVYEITAVDVPNNRWTLSSSMGTAGQTICANMGGAWANLTNLLASAPLIPASCFVWIKGDIPGHTSSYIRDSTTVKGYGTTRYDGVRARIYWSANFTIGMQVSGCIFENLNIDFGGYTRTSGNVLFLSCTRVKNVRCYNGIAASTGQFGSNNAILIDCMSEIVMTGVSSSFGSFSNQILINCISVDAYNAFIGLSGCVYINCIAINAATRGFYYSGAVDNKYFNCLTYNCYDGFTFSDARNYLNRCLAVNSGRYGFSMNSLGAMENCAAYGSTTADILNAPPKNINFQALSANPLNNPAGGDYSLNNVTGGGADIRSIVKDFTGLSSTTAYSSAGPIEIEGGGGSGNVGIVGGILGS